MSIFAIQFLALPSRQYLDVLAWLLALAVILHIVFMWVFLSSGFMHILFRLSKRYQPGNELSRFAEGAGNGMRARGVLSLLPALLSALAIVFITKILLQDNYGRLTDFLFFLLIPFAIGSLILFASGIIYADTGRRFRAGIVAGIAGMAVITAVYFSLYAIIRLMVDREKILFVQQGFPVYFIVALMPGCLHFFSVLMAGTGIVSAFYISNRDALHGDYPELARKACIILTLFFLLIQPVFIVSNLVTLPVNAVSMDVFIFAASCLICLFAAAIFSFMLISARGAGLYAAASIFIALSASGMVMLNLTAAKNAFKEQETARSAGIEKARAELVSAREEKMARDSVADGNEVFKRVCSNCHDFSIKRVGPPLEAVLPKYKDNPGALSSFIKQPVKVNPDYPQMPAPALKPAEREAVVKYLLERMDKK
ncbi:MAG: cytochrome c [Planctomycetes bacterium]|nr:cytochrome c [Planctomycetota bacterium]